jgi:hypothetical protein
MFYELQTLRKSSRHSNRREAMGEGMRDEIEDIVTLIG